ncbi:hypothetical protein KP509_20G068600 [Ceratopteris richardii]|uniref:Uncharacterized protein n=1 Tax=Ceratopteris richardii TaxID=49495 RepID=A0A8T2SIA0_CERRI|nr:hypothetical protein KP509_20G068600 [Ceratopteris richardii]
MFSDHPARESLLDGSFIAFSISQFVERESYYQSGIMVETHHRRVHTFEYIAVMHRALYKVVIAFRRPKGKLLVGRRRKTEVSTFPLRQSVSCVVHGCRQQVNGRFDLCGSSDGRLLTKRRGHKRCGFEGGVGGSSGRARASETLAGRHGSCKTSSAYA